jgi:hypothetical protein
LRIKGERPEHQGSDPKLKDQKEPFPEYVRYVVEVEQF